MKRLNYPLIFGAIIVLSLVSIIVFQDAIVKIDPYGINLGEFEYENGKFEIDHPPNPPNEVNFFGTDMLGRDIFSQIVVGAGITMKIVLLATLFRFLIAIPLAFLSGFGEKVSLSLIRFFSLAFSAIPSLIVSMIILNLWILRRLELDQSIIAFAMVLALVGWGRLAETIQGRVRNILNQDFIKGEIAIGKSKVLIAIQNVLPHLTASLIVYGFLEVGNALQLLAALGVFGVYAGVNKLDGETIRMMNLAIIPNYNPEWGGMLASARYAISALKPWVALFPAMAFFISILGFNLLGEGLQYEINKRNSMVITWLKRLALHLSPKTFIYEIKNYNEHKKPILIKVSIIIAILIIPLIPAPRSLYKINSEELYSYLEELNDDKYEGRFVSSKGGDEIGRFTENELKAMKLKPIFTTGYTQELISNSGTLADISNSELTIRDMEGKVINSFQYRKNFTYSPIFMAPPWEGDSFSISMKEVNLSGEILTKEQYDNGEFSKDKSYFLVIDDENNARRYLNGNYDWEINQIFEKGPIRGVIVPAEDSNILEYKKIPKVEDNNRRLDKIYYEWPFTIVVDNETKETIKENKGRQIALKGHINAKKEVPIRNIGGYIEGKNTENPIVIITNYDYYGYDETGEYKGLYENGTSIAAALELAKTLSSIGEKPERTIAFAFLDSSKVRNHGANMFSTGEYMDDDVFYIYMNYLGLKDSDMLYLDTSLITSSNTDAYQYVRYVKKRAKQLKLDFKQDQIHDRHEDPAVFMRDRSTGVMFKSITSQEEIRNYYGMRQNDINKIDKDKLSKHVQLILDGIMNIVVK